MLTFDFNKKGDIGIKKDKNDIVIEFNNLITPNGLETWKNKQIINLDLKDSNDGYNVKIEIQHLEHELVKLNKLDDIDVSNYILCPLIKLDRYLRINIPDDKLILVKPNDKLSGKIIISKVWYFGKQYGLYCKLI